MTGKIIIPNAVKIDKKYNYYIDKEGNVCSFLKPQYTPGYKPKIWSKNIVTTKKGKKYYVSTKIKKLLKKKLKNNLQQMGFKEDRKEMYIEREILEKENVITNPEGITPIEAYQSILLKRDDLFKSGEVNGGKLRQAIYLIKNNLPLIKEKFASSVICSCSIKSPQSAIISEVCKNYGLTCNIVTYHTKEPNINLSIAQDNGAKIYGVGSGYSSVINAKAREFKTSFFINMGFESPEVLEANIDQAQNLPKDLDYLVIPIGSAMNFISILRGLQRYNITPKQIIGVYIGKDPQKMLERYSPPLKYRLVKYAKPYGTEVDIDNLFFDPIYEAKVYKWLLHSLQMELATKKILLWVVGKRNLTYTPKPINYL